MILQFIFSLVSFLYGLTDPVEVHVDLCVDARLADAAGVGPVADQAHEIPGHVGYRPVDQGGAGVALAAVLVCNKRPVSSLCIDQCMSNILHSCFKSSC